MINIRVQVFSRSIEKMKKIKIGIVVLSCVRNFIKKKLKKKIYTIKPSPIRNEEIL